MHLVIFQSIHCHLPGPLICLRMDSGTVQHLNVCIVSTARDNVYEPQTWNVRQQAIKAALKVS